MRIKFSGIYEALIRLRFRLQLEYNWQNFKVRKKYKNVFLSLKNTHNGERCFVIGNGPSLTAKDLSMLKDEYCFAANRVFYIYNKTDWRPTYYCAQDEVVINDILSDLDRIQPQSKKMFLISSCYNKVSKELRTNKDVLFFCAKYAKAHKNRLFSRSIEKNISGGGSITYAAIQIAVYMGFTEIYLLGVDHNYATTTYDNKTMGSSDVKANYFEGMPESLKVNRPNTDNSTLSFIKAKECCDALGIKVFNATRGGKLEVFPRKQLEEIVKNG